LTNKPKSQYRLTTDTLSQKAAQVTFHRFVQLGAVPARTKEIELNGHFTKGAFVKLKMILAKVFHQIMPQSLTYSRP
jgi:hypothetical protein